MLTNGNVNFWLGTGVFVGTFSTVIFPAFTTLGTSFGFHGELEIFVGVSRVEVRIKLIITVQ